MVLIIDLTRDNVNSLIVVLVDWLGELLLLARLHELLVSRRLVGDRILAQSVARFHQRGLVSQWFSALVAAFVNTTCAYSEGGGPKLDLVLESRAGLSLPKTT